MLRAAYLDEELIASVVYGAPSMTSWIKQESRKVTLVVGQGPWI